MESLVAPTNMTYEYSQDTLKDDVPNDVSPKYTCVIFLYKYLALFKLLFYFLSIKTKYSMKIINTRIIFSYK